MNYPNKANRTYNKVTNYSNKGMALEDDLNRTNTWYLNNDIAVVYKKPTPIQIVKVDYPQRSKAKITEAYFKKPSTTDYNGVYKGKYIDFEAKECDNLNLFSFSKIYDHQVEHLKKVSANGGIGFIVIRFNKRNETWLIRIEDFLTVYQDKNNKSISYKWISDFGYLIPMSYNKPCDYLLIVDKLMRQIDEKR